MYIIKPVFLGPDVYHLCRVGSAAAAVPGSRRRPRRLGLGKGKKEDPPISKGKIGQSQAEENRTRPWPVYDYPIEKIDKKIILERTARV